MARYTGPRARVSRRLGTNIWGTKGENKVLEKRPYPPGEHGRTRRRGNVSEYLLQLQEKQKARYTYGLSERQFRNLFAEANRREGVTGLNMLRYLELRLDNVVYRAGWAATRPQARQLVSHGHIDVNGRRVDIPSYRVSEDDIVEVAEKSRELDPFIIARAVAGEKTVPAWLEVLPSRLRVLVHTLPVRQVIDTQVQEQLIVEFYSK